MMIFLIIFPIIIMAGIAPFAQIRFLEVEPKYFKKIKIKKCAFLFKGIGGKDCIYGSSKDYGVIIPMFAMQVMGYVLAILSSVLAPILIFAFKLDLTTTAIVSVSIFGVQAITLSAVMLTCIAITRKMSRGRDT